jgi:hypothetical protein
MPAENMNNNPINMINMNGAASFQMQQSLNPAADLNNSNSFNTNTFMASSYAGMSDR